MSRSKNKIAVTTLLSALACSATASAAGQNGKDIKSVESQTSFSTRKSSESSIKSARSLEGAKSWFEKLPTGAKIAMFVSAPILAAEIYNEIAGAVSGKKWYSGKYSFVNLARGKGEDENPEPGDGSNPLRNGENQDEIKNKINNETENKITDTNQDGVIITNEKKDTDLGAAPSSLTKEQEEQLNNVLGQFKEAAKNVPELYEKFEAQLKYAFSKIIKGEYKSGDDKHSGKTMNAIVNFVTGKNKQIANHEVVEISALKKSFKIEVNIENKDTVTVFVSIDNASNKLHIVRGYDKSVNSDIILLD